MVPVTTVQLALTHRVETPVGRGTLTEKRPVSGGYALVFQLDSGASLVGTYLPEKVWEVELTS